MTKAEFANKQLELKIWRTELQKTRTRMLVESMKADEIIKRIKELEKEFD